MRSLTHSLLKGFAALALLAVPALAAACSAPLGSPTPGLAPPPAATAAEASLPSPESNLFYSLPMYSAGEAVLLEGYGIHLGQVAHQDGDLALSLTITNTADAPLDMVWALQLRDAQGGLVSPRIGQERLAQVAGGDSLHLLLTYPPAQTVQGVPAPSLDAYHDYRLVFAPRGWAGPVIVFRLDS